MDRSKWETILTLFQAYARGYLVRREVCRAREDFEDIVREIDGDLAHLQWRGATIPIPHFTDTDGPLLSPRPSSKLLKPEPDVSACHQKPPSAALREKTGENHHLLPEKLEAEKDDTHCQVQASLSSVCSPSNPTEGDGEGQRHSLGGQVGNGDADGAGRLMESTGDSTIIWSSQELDMNYGHFHRDLQQHRLAQEVPRTPEALRLHRNTLAMELLWLQQAIASRKKYLSLKERLNVS